MGEYDTRVDGHSRPVSVAAAAEALHVTPQTITRWVSEGRLTATRVGEKWLVFLDHGRLLSQAKIESEQRRKQHEAALSAKAEQRKAVEKQPDAPRLRAQLADIEIRLAALPVRAADLAEEARAAILAGDREREDTLSRAATYVRTNEKSFLLNQLEEKRAALAYLERSPSEVREELMERRGRCEREALFLQSQARNASWGAVGGLGPESAAARRLDKLRGALQEIDGQLASLGPAQATAPATPEKRERPAPPPLPVL
jgi:excisionase family DNA binding protein